MVGPEDIAGLVAFADEQEKSGRPAAAAVVYRGLYEATKDPAYLVRAAGNTRKSGDTTTASALADLLLRDFGMVYQACMEAGFSKIDTGAYIEAFAAFHAAYRSHRTAEAAAWCGVALRRDGNRRAACDYYRLALSLDADQITAGMELASCLDESGDFAGAIELYRRRLAARDVPDLTYIYNRLGSCYQRSGRTDLLAGVLDDPLYYENLNAAYGPESTLLWSLRLGKAIDDERVLAALKHQVPIPNQTADALTLYLHRDISPSLRAAYEQMLKTSSYGLDADRIMGEHPPERVHKPLSHAEFLSEDQAVDIICQYIKQARPLSFIRLGDGEGNVLGHLMNPDSTFLRAQLDKILRNWFGGSALPISEYAPLFAEFRRSIADSDILGVPTSARLEYELTNEPRGYWGVYFSALYSCVYAANRPFVTPVLHLQLFRRPAFVAALKSAHSLNTISCHAGLGPTLRTQLGLRVGSDLIVPGEMEAASLPAESRRGSHYPSEYQRVTSAITHFVPGSVVLIAAGICGKIYAYRARQAGCIAIDIGAIADFLMGRNTRAIFSDQRFRESHPNATQLIAVSKSA